MQLYDGKSSVTWHGIGKLTPAKMKKDARFSAMFETDAVLIDNGEGVCYTWHPLAELLAKYGAESFEDLPDAIQASWQPKPTDEQQRIEDLEAAVIELAALYGGDE